MNLKTFWILEIEFIRNACNINKMPLCNFLFRTRRAYLRIKSIIWRIYYDMLFRIVLQRHKERSKSIHKSRRNRKINSIFIFIHVTQQQSLEVLFNLYLVPFNFVSFLSFFSSALTSSQLSQHIWIDCNSRGTCRK